MIESLNCSKIKNKLFDYINCLVNPIYERAEVIAKDIDNNLFPSFFKSVMSDSITPEKSTECIINISNQMLSHYENIFNICTEEYKHQNISNICSEESQNQNINSLQNIDALLCIFLKQFLLCYPTKEIQNYFADPNAENYRKIRSFSILHKIRNFRFYPSPIQSSLAQILMRIDSEGKRLNFMMYIINKLNRKFQYEKIDDRDRINYINQALKFPIQEVLNHFHKSEIPLNILLDRATKDIYLFKFPEHHYGFTTTNQQIMINLFSEAFVKKGAAFIILLHELAHYLQRADCSTVEEAMERKSFGPEGEGGRLLEVMLFGHTVHHLTGAAANFLLQDNFPQDIKEFQDKFDLENNITDGLQKDYVLLSDSSEVILLGHCACSYGILF